MRELASKRAIELTRLRGRIRDAVRDFQRLTGVTAITTLGSASTAGGIRGLPSPSVHPRCAERLRGIAEGAPCDSEWREHLNSARRTRGSRAHTCPLGLRCVGVPIFVGDGLLGMGKVVCGPEVSPGRFRSLVRVFESLILRPCQDLHVSLLRDEIRSLRASVDRLHRVKRPARPAGEWAEGRDPAREGSDEARRAQAVIGKALAYLDQHYADRNLSLARVASAVGRNEKYLSHLFVQQVGERMRTYIADLRVQRSCELLLQTDLAVGRIAGDCGFSHAAQFRQAFRRSIGVTASEYRQIFTAGAQAATRR